ncbi:hypothetical protein ACFVWG_20605 [Kribbella sp. NPDC058245]|uniref:hypothetical protein n=1 Tax=Kribbella sp. NPDC058245 TaxID=3346399 RepID=UPI0036E2DEE5
MGSVAVPEKTLEHWSSQYLSYRFKAKASLWWPSKGEDIRVTSLPRRPGKAVQIELKTTTITAANRQDVLIDLLQLWNYLQLPLSQQPFYAFPRPVWSGELHSAALAAGKSVTELAYGRSGPKWWFAKWMVVLTAAEIARALHPKFDLAVRPARKSLASLVRYEFTGRTKTELWGPRQSLATPPDPVDWREFWNQLLRCGQTKWPQLVRVPARALPTHLPDSIPSETVLDMLADVGGPHQPIDDLVDLVPHPDGGFRLGRERANNAPVVIEGAPDEHRQLVFLDASSMA